MIRKLEQYEILDEIGHGGMATVFRARDTHLDRMVAIKILHPHLQKAPEARVRFSREAKSVAKLRHPNILEIYAYSGEESEESYISAELLTGPTLKKFTEDAYTSGVGIAPQYAACFALQVAAALREAHANGVVHRDVKPENVLLHEDRCVKLTDFGIAQMVDSQSFTATGQILGSPGHMAPEQIEGVECDERTDVFSLGTVLYHLAVGRLPFVGRNPHQVLRQIMDAEFPDPERINPKCGTLLADIINKSMRKDPGDRFQSAEEMEAALRMYLANLGIDDPDEVLCLYLKNPEEELASRHIAMLPMLIENGKRALKEGNQRLANAHFNHVLAIDDGNEAVLSIMNNDTGTNGKARAVGMVALVALVGAGAYGLVGQKEDPKPIGDEPTVVTVAESQDAGVEQGLADVALDETVDSLVNAPEQRVRRPVIRVSGPRQVVFRPSPQAVKISVDGAPARAYGPEFRSQTLSPGTHTFTFSSETDCCEDVTFKTTVPAGDTPFAVAKQLPFRPAAVYIVSNAAGRVSIGGKDAGTTRSMIRTPIGKFRDVRKVIVTAPGHKVYTTELELRAGEVTEHRVVLEKASDP